MPSLDDGSLTATVWWNDTMMKGNATMWFFGNYGKVTMNAAGPGAFQFYEIDAQKVTSSQCGATAEGLGSYLAEIRTFPTAGSVA